MTLFFYILIGVITFVAFINACIKKEYDISRTIVINKPRTEVFAFVRQLKKQHLWTPWFSKDSDVLLKFKGEDGYEGATIYWKGDKKKIGEGTQKIIKIREGKVMETKLVFVKPYKTVALGYLAVKELEPEKTKMVWGIRGRHKFPGTLITLFYSTDRILGKDFEAGLQNLKQILESR